MPRKLIGAGSGATKEARVEELRSLMVSFGQLTEDGRYVVHAAEPGQDDGSDRAGFLELPGVRPGRIAEAIEFDRLLDSMYWDKTRFYQPVDFLWQPTLFQPVGGIDQVQHAFVQQVAMLGGVVHLNSPVTRIDYDAGSGQFLIEATGHDAPFRADYCFCNIAVPFLQTVLSERLQAPGGGTGFSEPFKQALRALSRFERAAVTLTFAAALAVTGASILWLPLVAAVIAMSRKGPPTVGSPTTASVLVVLTACLSLLAVT